MADEFKQGVRAFKGQFKWKPTNSRYKCRYTAFFPYKMYSYNERLKANSITATIQFYW